MRRHRMILYGLIRRGLTTYYVERLEPDREYCAAQLAYVMADFEERVGSWRGRETRLEGRSPVRGSGALFARWGIGRS